MARKKKKSASKTPPKSVSFKQKLLSSLGFLKQSPFLALLLVFLWIPWSGHVWTIGQEGLWLPLKTEGFQSIWSLFGNHRVVFSYWLLHPSLFLMSYLGPLSLAALFYMLKASLPIERGTSKYVAFFITCCFAKFALPGEFPLPILKLIFIIFLLQPLFTEKPRPFQTWLVLSIAVLISLMTKIYFFGIFWLSLCLIFGHLIHFIFVSRLQVSYAEKKHLSFSLPYSLGLFSLFFWILLAYYLGDWPRDTFTVSKYFWIGFIPSSLSVFCAWLKPWKSLLWLQFASFGLGSLLSHEMVLPLLVVSAWLVVFILREISSYLSRLKTPFFNLMIKHWILLLFILGLSLYGLQIYRTDPVRELNPKWLQVVDEIHKENPDGLLLYGNSLAFISYFFSGSLYQNAPIELVHSQNEFLQWMKKNRVSVVVVDLDYLRKRWIQMMHDGVPPNEISRSILSRLTTSDGSAIETSTLKLEQVTEFQSKKLKDNSLVWITIKND